MQVKEIYLAKVDYNDCDDIRPCVIVELFGTLATIAPISASDLKKGIDFLISKNHPDFLKTGLKKNSYISGEKFQEIEVKELRKYCGKITGQLEIEFDNWLGV